MNRREQRIARTEGEKSRGGGQSGLQFSVPGPQSLEVRIEEVVLHGFAPGDRSHIGAVVERELLHLFTEQGIPLSFARSADVSRLDAGVFQAASGGRGERMGAQVAQAVYESFNKGGS